MLLRCCCGSAWPEVWPKLRQLQVRATCWNAMMLCFTLLAMFQVSCGPLQPRRGAVALGRPPQALSAVHAQSASKLAVSSSRSAAASQLLKFLSGQKLTDLNLTASLARSVQLLGVNLSCEGLAAWKVFDDSLCSSSCPYPLHSFLSRKVLPVPQDIEHSHCKLSIAPFFT